MKRILGYYALPAVVMLASLVIVAKVATQNNFWNEAAQIGMAEVMLSNLALQNSQNEAVKSFAQQMVTDHTAANEELKSLAAGKNVTLPTDVNRKQKSAMSKLSGMTGPEFDKQFIKQMVSDHETAVKVFQRQADTGSDAEVKAFAVKTLPTLQGHLQMARTMSSGMRGGRGDKAGNSNRRPNMNSNMMMNSNSNMNSNMMMNSNGDMNSNMMMNSNSNMNSDDMVNSDPHMNSNMMMNSNSNMNSNMMMNSNIMNSNTNRNMNRNPNVNSNSNSNINGN